MYMLTCWSSSKYYVDIVAIFLKARKISLYLFDTSLFVSDIGEVI